MVNNEKTFQQLMNKGKPIFLIEGEILIEETILKYRRIEMEKMKSKMQFKDIIKIYETMNNNLNDIIERIKEQKKFYSIQQLNNCNDKESPLPNIFNGSSVESTSIQSSIKYGKLPKPPVTDVQIPFAKTKRKKNEIKSKDEQKSNDSETLLSSCSDTIEESINKASEKKPRRRKSSKSKKLIRSMTLGSSTITQNTDEIKKENTI